MPIERLGIFGRRWCTALRDAGVRTAADLLAADAEQLAQQHRLPAGAVATIRRRQAAVRLTALVPALPPRGALLLVAVHRRDMRRLAAESPGRLHRDLARFALSSAGQTLLRGRPAPDLEVVRRWVIAARQRSGMTV